MGYLSKEQNESLNRARTRVRALNHPLRQKMLEVIKENSNRMNVTDIYVKLRIEQSIASQMLSIMRREGLVQTERDGKTIWYSVDDVAINHLLQGCVVVNSSPSPASRPSMSEAVLS